MACYLSERCSFGEISVKCATACVFEDIDFGKWPKKLVEQARVNCRASPIPASTLLRILNSVLPLRDSTFLRKNMIRFVRPLHYSLFSAIFPNPVTVVFCVRYSQTKLSKLHLFMLHIFLFS